MTESNRPMSRERWAAIVLGVIGAFLVSVAIGGFVARQLGPQQTGLPVALASPTPGVVTSASASVPPVTGQPSLALATTAATPTDASVDGSTAAPTGSPTEVPATTATSAPATALASQPASAPPTTPVSTDQPPSGPPPTEVPATALPTAAPTSGLDPPTVEEFATDLAAAIRDGDNAYLLSRLHPATIERYSLRMCRQHINQVVSGTDVAWEILGSSGPAPWDYTKDGLTATIDDAWVVSINDPAADPPARDLHFAPLDGTWRWFADCGDPT